MRGPGRARRTALAAALFGLSGLTGCALLHPEKGAPDFEGLLAPAAGSPDRKSEQATVRIHTVGCDQISSGSGVVIGERELLTNAHVIAGAEDLEITTWDGRTVKAALTGAFVESDLALVHVDADLPAAAELAAADAAVGAELVVFGFPGGGRFRVERGTLQEFATVGNARVMVISNRVRPGNSGGPVFDDSGKVVGLVEALLTETDQGVAIPVSTVKPAVDAMRGRQAGEAPGCDAFGDQGGTEAPP